MTDERRLRWAALFFVAAVLFHNGDHVRRGADGVGLDVFWAGTAAMILEVGVVALVLARHRLAPLAAVAVGVPLGLGYLFVHFTPARSWLSDSFTSGDVAAVSWAAGGIEALAAFLLAAAGWAVVRRQGLASFGRPGARRHARTVHPVTAVMAAGNVVIFAVSLAQIR